MPRRLARTAIAVVAVLPWNGVHAAPARILFIGNSLTTVNDVPGLVEALSVAAGGRLECHSVAFDGYSLEDHWNRGDAQRAIAKGGWSTVHYARRFSAQAHRVGAATALYMVWPSRDRLSDFDGVNASYAAAAREVGACSSRPARRGAPRGRSTRGSSSMARTGFIRRRLDRTWKTQPEVRTEKSELRTRNLEVWRKWKAGSGSAGRSRSAMSDGRRTRHRPSCRST
jgi:hypothetical protein